MLRQVFARDDHVVEQAEAEFAFRGTQAGGHRDVLRARVERSARVVVGEGERDAVVPEHQREDLADRDGAAGGTAASNGEHPRHPLLVVGDQQDDLFDTFPPDERRGHGGDVGGRAEDPAPRLPGEPIG
jgi:hypothetical protein